VLGSVCFQFTLFDGLIGSCILLASRGLEDTKAELQEVKRGLQEQQGRKLMA
jgi:hypothetical protein